MNILLVTFILLIACIEAAIEPPQPKRRNKNQPDEVPGGKHTTIDQEVLSNPQIVLPTKTSNTGNIKVNSNHRSLSDCTTCWATKRNTLQLAVDSFWQNDLHTAFACACNQLLSNPNDGTAQAIIYALTQTKTAPFTVSGKVAPPSTVAPPIRRWEVLGPINVGKLEHDADATFQHAKLTSQRFLGMFDPVDYMLGAFYNESVHSELAAGGKVKWAVAKASDQGEVNQRLF